MRFVLHAIITVSRQTTSNPIHPIRSIHLSKKMKPRWLTI